MVAAKANATLPPGKRTKTPAVPAASRASESLSSDASEHKVLAGKVTMEELSWGEGEDGSAGVWAGATSPAEGCVHEAGREGLLYPNHDYRAMIRGRRAEGSPGAFAVPDSQLLAASVLL